MLHRHARYVRRSCMFVYCMYVCYVRMRVLHVCYVCMYGCLCIGCYDCVRVVYVCMIRYVCMHIMFASYEFVSDA